MFFPTPPALFSSRSPSGIQQVHKGSQLSVSLVTHSSLPSQSNKNK